jgi:hypothetical protein
VRTPVVPARAPVAPAASPVAPASTARIAPPRGPVAAAGRAIAPATDTTIAPAAGGFKDRLLAEIRGAKGFFYNTVVAQAQRIDVADDRVTFTFLPTHRALREQFEQSRAWLESTAERVAGRRVTVSAVQSAGPQDAPADAGAPPAAAAVTPDTGGARRDLKAAALESSAVQAMLEVFPAEIRDVEEM